MPIEQVAIQNGLYNNDNVINTIRDFVLSKGIGTVKSDTGTGNYREIELLIHDCPHVLRTHWLGNPYSYVQLYIGDPYLFYEMVPSSTVYLTFFYGDHIFSVLFNSKYFIYVRGSDGLWYPSDGAHVYDRDSKADLTLSRGGTRRDPSGTMLCFPTLFLNPFGEWVGSIPAMLGVGEPSLATDAFFSDGTYNYVKAGSSLLRDI